MLNICFPVFLITEKTPKLSFIHAYIYLGFHYCSSCSTTLKFSLLQVQVQCPSYRVLQVLITEDLLHGSAVLFSINFKVHFRILGLTFQVLDKYQCALQNVCTHIYPSWCLKLSEQCLLATHKAKKKKN